MNKLSEKKKGRMKERRDVKRRQKIQERRIRRQGPRQFKGGGLSAAVRVVLVIIGVQQLMNQ